MAMIDKVKPRIGIFYSEASKDTEIRQMIAGAQAFLISGGWPAEDFEAESAEAVEAVVLYCKMAQNVDPAEMKIHPVLISMIANARARGTVTE